MPRPVLKKDICFLLVHIKTCCTDMTFSYAVKKRIGRVEDDCLKTMEKVSEVAQTYAEANTALKNGFSLLSTRLEELSRGHGCFESAVQDELEQLREEVDTAKTAADIKASTAVMIKQSLAERIDAISARLDAVEAAAGVRKVIKVAKEV